VSLLCLCDELQKSSEACFPSDLGARVTSVGADGLLLARNGIKQYFRVKHENVSSPSRLSESEESVAGENLESRLKDRGSGSFEVDKRAVNSVQNVVPSVLFTMLFLLYCLQRRLMYSISEKPEMVSRNEEGVAGAHRFLVPTFHQLVRNWRLQLQQSRLDAQSLLLKRMEGVEIFSLLMG
jgi:hypothetical protein